MKQPEYSDLGQQSNQNKENSELAEPIRQNIETVAELHKHSEHSVSRPQRAIERVTSFLGRPRFLFLILIFVAFWMLINVLLIKLGQQSFDPAPYFWLQGVLSLGAVLMSTVVLITQNRQDKVAELRMQLDIQASLLIEQKLSKLIEMVDELRQDNSTGVKPHDPQAEVMKESIDPHQVVSTLKRSLQEAEEAAREM